MKQENISNLILRIESLEKAVFGDSSKTSSKRAKNVQIAKLDYSLNIRAFVKRHVADKSGPKKFVLLLAYIAKGDAKKDIAMSDIQKEWEKMSGKKLLGNFNRFYSSEAKTQGWVNSNEYGCYRLASDWKEVL
jgi:hypothetical protein